MNQRFIFICFLLAISLHICTAETETLRVLGIGNSFTNNAFQFLGPLSDASQTHKFELGKAIIGGCSLERHVTHLKEHEADPKTGIAYACNIRSITGENENSKAALRTILKARAWDIVTIQQASKWTPDYNTYQPFASELVAYIQLHAPQAKILIHQTWAYRIDGDFATVWPDIADYNQEDMYKDSCKAYTKLAKEFGFDLIPVGAAFQLARERRPFVAAEIDKSAYVAPQLPAQENSLCVGWRWGKGTLGNDSHHANSQGCLLAALVWYEQLTKQDCRTVELTALPCDAETTKFLKQVSHDVVSNQLRPAIQPLD